MDNIRFKQAVKHHVENLEGPYYLKVYTDKHYIDQLIKAYNPKDPLFKGLIIPQLFYYADHLEALEHFTEIKELVIQNENILDYKGLSYIKNLKHLSIFPKTKIQEKLAIGNLEKLECNGNIGVQNLQGTKLTRLSIVNIDNFDGIKLPQGLMALNLKKGNSKHKAINLEGLIKLKTIQIDHSNFSRFKNIEACQNLESIELYACKNFVGLGDLIQLPKLKKLKIVSSNQIDGFDVISRLNLDWFYIKYKGKDYFSEDKQLNELISATKSDQYTLPTALWIKRLANGDKAFSKECISESKVQCEKFYLKVVSHKKWNNQEYEENLKNFIEEMNLLGGASQAKYGNFIESLEREELYNFINDMSNLAGIKVEEDKILNWRDW